MKTTKKNPNKVQTQLEKLVLFGQKIREIIIFNLEVDSATVLQMLNYVLHAYYFLKSWRVISICKMDFFLNGYNKLLS